MDDLTQVPVATDGQVLGTDQVDVGMGETSRGW